MLYFLFSFSSYLGPFGVGVALFLFRKSKGDNVKIYLKEKLLKIYGFVQIFLFIVLICASATQMLTLEAIRSYFTENNTIIFLASAIVTSSLLLTIPMIAYFKSVLFCMKNTNTKQISAVDKYAHCQKLAKINLVVCIIITSLSFIIYGVLNFLPYILIVMAICPFFNYRIFNYCNTK